jgi:hypothetical protein
MTTKEKLHSSHEGIFLILIINSYDTTTCINISFYSLSIAMKLTTSVLVTTLSILGSLPGSQSFLSKPTFRINTRSTNLYSTTVPSPSPSSTTTRTKPVAVLICPAQFCVPADYETFISTLQEKSPHISSGRVANLPRTEWIKVARQLPTSDFFSATLNNAKTLEWYFNAIESGLADIYAEEGYDVDVCIIGHSIGGWVARSYLGGLAQRSTAVYRSTIERCTSLVTLGTPHKSPETALVDQTRGLLRAVEETKGCSSEGLAENGISVTCVGSTAVEGKILPTDLEQLVATTSYLPLVDNWKDIFNGITGDGIIPRDLAFMDGCANRVEVEKCSITGNNVRHAHVLPTPYNLWEPAAPSISLPEDFCWYGSEGVIDQWIDYI